MTGNRTSNVSNLKRQFIAATWDRGSNGDVHTDDLVGFIENNLFPYFDTLEERLHALEHPEQLAENQSYSESTEGSQNQTTTQSESSNEIERIIQKNAEVLRQNPPIMGPGGTLLNYILHQCAQNPELFDELSELTKTGDANFYLDTLQGHQQITVYLLGTSGYNPQPMGSPRSEPTSGSSSKQTNEIEEWLFLEYYERDLLTIGVNIQRHHKRFMRMNSLLSFSRTPNTNFPGSWDQQSFPCNPNTGPLFSYRYEP